MKLEEDVVYQEVMEVVVVEVEMLKGWQNCNDGSYRSQQMGSEVTEFGHTFLSEDYILGRRNNIYLQK